MKHFLPLKVFAVILVFIFSSLLFAEQEIDQVTDDKKERADNEPERDYYVYVIGGGSHFQQDVGATVGKGASLKLGCGVQYNKWFGLEFYAESAPSIEPKAVLEDLRQSISQRILGYDIKTQANRYAGVMGTFSFDVHPQLTLVGKVGVAKYEAHRITGGLTLDNRADNILFTYRWFERGVEGYSPVVSFGYETPIPYPDSKKTSAELMLTYMMDDNVNSLSLTAMIKYTF